MIKHSFQQGHDGSCGPAALKIALDHLGIEKSEKELVKLVRFSKIGVELEDLLRVAKKFRVKGFVKENVDIKDIRKYLKKKGHSIIVGWFFKDNGHKHHHLCLGRIC